MGYWSKNSAKKLLKSFQYFAMRMKAMVLDKTVLLYLVTEKRSSINFYGKCSKDAFEMGSVRQCKINLLRYHYHPVNQRRLCKDYPLCSKRPGRLEHFG